MKVFMRTILFVLSILFCTPVGAMLDFNAPTKNVMEYFKHSYAQILEHIQQLEDVINPPKDPVKGIVNWWYGTQTPVLTEEDIAREEGTIKDLIIELLLSTYLFKEFQNLFGALSEEEKKELFALEQNASELLNYFDQKDFTQEKKSYKKLLDLQQRSKNILKNDLFLFIPKNESKVFAAHYFSILLLTMVATYLEQKNVIPSEVLIQSVDALLSLVIQKDIKPEDVKKLQNDNSLISIIINRFGYELADLYQKQVEFLISSLQALEQNIPGRPLPAVMALTQEIEQLTKELNKPNLSKEQKDQINETIKHLTLLKNNKNELKKFEMQKYQIAAMKLAFLHYIDPLLTITQDIESLYPEERPQTPTQPPVPPQPQTETKPTILLPVSPKLQPVDVLGQALFNVTQS